MADRKDKVHDGACCGCGHEHDGGCHSTGCHCGENLAVAHDAEERNALPVILVGAGVFVCGILMGQISHMEMWAVVLYVLAYVILGGEIVIKSVKGILRRDIFDENFLMSIASIGAFVIGEYPEAVGVMLFYRVGEWFEDRAVEKSRKQIMDAIDMRPETVTIVTEDGKKEIRAEEAKVGEFMLVRPGERIPLDGVIVEGASRIDTSPVTGEPVPTAAGAGDAVLSGCVNVNGLLKIKITSGLQDSMVTKIMDMVEHAANHKPAMEKFITRFARVYTPFVVTVAVLTAVIPSLVTGDWYNWVYTALTFLVISCPCALVLSVPLAYFSAIGAGSRLGVLFKGGASVEALGRIKTVVMDKTGTLTKGNFIVQKCIPQNGVKEEELLQLCAMAEKNSSHPIAVSIVAAAKERNLMIEEPDAVEEIAGKGLVVQTSEGEILCGNRTLLLERGIHLPQDTTELYGTEVFMALRGKYIGKLLIADTIKEDAEDAVQYMKSIGLKTAMLTGDSGENAEHVARKLGIDMFFAKMLPEDKLNCLRTIREENGKVLFVGDGINDAPVLAGADVGAAMGSGADAAVEAADVVFLNSGMNAVAQAVSLSLRTRRVAGENVVFALVVKALIMVLGLVGFANMWWAVLADTGVAMICILNSIRLLYGKYNK